MQLTIIRKNKLNIFTLPNEVSGNYWITDFENGRKINLLNIEATKEGWNLVSNSDAYVVDSKGMMVPYVLLKEYNFYLLKNNYKDEMCYIYCSPVYDNTYKELPIESKVLVGSDESCNICYKLVGMPQRAFTIEKKDKYFYLDIFDATTSVYVNQKRVIQTKRLEYGDIIFIFGLKIIVMRRENHDYLLVNNPNKLLVFDARYVNPVFAPNDEVIDEEELNTESIYNEDNYFYRTPRFYKTLEKYVLDLDVPPTKKEDDKTPAILTIGPMMTMAMTSVVTLIFTLDQMNSGEGDVKSQTRSLVMCGAMLASSLLWPLLTRAYQKISNKLYERKRQKLYKKYIKKKEEEIINELEIQRKSLLENNFTVTGCQDIIRGHNIKLWQRRVNDEDFLTLPVGIGNKPMQVDIKYPEEHFTLEEDNLIGVARALGQKERILNDVPITYSFYDNKATGIIGDNLTTKEFIDRLILQIMANYSYDELKIVLFTSKDNEKDWDYIKILPHNWSNDRTLRFFASSNDEYREIIYNLEKILAERKELNRNNEKCIPHYVIITDSIKSIDNYDFIKNIMSSEVNYGFNIIMLVDKVMALPNECRSFINVSREDCSIYSSVINSEIQKFKIDFSPIEEISNCARELANIPIDIKTEVESSLPDKYEFLEMYQVGKIEQLNSEERWKKNNPILSLQAPVGIGKSGEPIVLDLHEKYHGPHGLIAGTTGSGKSEFIITYILSLAINYNPYEVQVILIDYKGGSLAGAFSNNMYQLPHLAGTITNLDGNELNRSLDSIESEVKRRQKEFNEARDIANESSIDIYKYQKLWREGRLKGKDPIAHLFIISDEFAELKEQQPEFMDKLISVARVGRSLGVHLILATQKPGGVVNAQIWSNTRFRVCLKVQDTADSQEIIKKPDAAYLKKTGRFYLQVGTDEVFTIGQSAWAGGQYYPNTIFKRDVDTSINAINNIGFITTTKDLEVKEEVKSLGEELPNIVKYLSELAAKNNIKIKKLWLDKIPEFIYVDNLIQKYKFEKSPYNINPIIGEYDDPSTQNQFALNVPMSDLGNVIIYGSAGSGKENFLTSLIYSCMVSYTPEEVNFYIVDFGAETLRVFNNSPYVGDIVYLSDDDKFNNLIKMINLEIDSRKEKFAGFGGTYQSYIKESQEKVPNWIIIFNNFESISDNYETLLDEIMKISRDAYKYGIYLVITTSSSNSIRSRLRQNFSLIYALQQNDENEYINILGNVHKKYPAKYKGRGIFKKGDIYEFQTAYVSKENTNDYLREFINNKLKETTYRAKKIPSLPKIVNFETINEYLDNGFDIPIGINKTTLLAQKYNFRKNPINLIGAMEIESTFEFINSFVNEIIYTNYYDLLFINTTENNFSNKNLEGRIYSKNFDELINKLGKYVDDVYKVYEENDFNEEVIKNQKRYMCIVYGTHDFINKLSDETKKIFTELIKKDNQINIISFVMVDTTDILKSYAFDDWFKTGTDSSRGIYIGSGITYQSLFKVSKYDSEDREDISNDYGYVVQTSKLYKVKLLTSFVPDNETENHV